MRHCRALFDALGPPKVHLVGASLGGRLAAQIAISYPDQVASLVLVAPAGIALAEFPQPDFSQIAHCEWPHYFMHNPDLIRPYWPSDPDESFLAARAREAHTVGHLLGDAAMTATNFRQALDRIQAPTLLVWGKEDRMVPVGNVQAWQAAISGSTIKIFEHAGHLLLDESPAARAAVAQFLIESTTNSRR